MDRNFYFLKQSRATTLASIEGLSLDELCRIPEGFNNSILWNIGHLAVTQQLICYQLSDLPMYIKDQTLIDGFRKGSQPKTTYTQEEWESVLRLFQSLPDEMVKDWETGKFKTFKPYLTSFGVALNSIEDAITFNNVHEGIHFGYILALKRAINK